MTTDGERRASEAGGHGGAVGAGTPDGDTASTPLKVRDNPGANRYETLTEGGVAKVDYRRMGTNVIALVHTEVPPESGGRGVARALARFALDDARRRGLEVIPFCPFVAAFIRRNPEYFDLVSTRYRKRDELRPPPGGP